MINIERILSNEELQHLETEQVYTTTIEAPQTSQILQFINKKLPKLSGLDHVKRVKKQQPNGPLSVILCQSSKIDEQQVKEIFEQSEQWKSLEIKITEVPRVPPYTKEQFDEWKLIWPVSFRPLEKIRKQQVAEEETEYIGGMVRELEHMSEMLSNSRGGGAAIIVDKKSKEVLAKSIDLTEKLGHPLKHSVMCCIDIVGKKEVEKRKRKKEEEGDSGYLCENADVFCLNEPCIMCCMALVHSRIGRLFFVHKSTKFSGSILVCRLQDNPKLNHHFAAFQISHRSLSC